MKSLTIALAIGCAAAVTARADVTVALGVGNGGLTGHRDERLTRGVFESTEFSWHLAPTFELLGEALTLTGANYAPDPTFEQDTVAVLAAARWTALRHGNHALYLQGGLGVSEMLREGYHPFIARATFVAIGFATELTVGYRYAVGPRAGFRAQLTDQPTYFSNGEGLRQTFGLVALAEITL